MVCCFFFFFSFPVPTHFMEMEQHFRNSIDLDAEQTEARYDQEMLSDIINDNDRGELQKAESCLVDDYKYDHGQKVGVWGTRQRLFLLCFETVE